MLILLALPLGGALGVFFYSRGSGHPAISASIGARIGAVTGLMGFSLYAILLGMVLLLQRDQFRSALQKALQDAVARNPDPQAQQLVNQLMSPGGMAVVVTFSAVFLLFIFLILCAIGGAIAGNLMKRTQGAA